MTHNRHCSVLLYHLVHKHLYRYYTETVACMSSTSSCVIVIDIHGVLVQVDDFLFLFMLVDFAPHLVLNLCARGSVVLRSSHFNFLILLRPQELRKLDR